MHILLFNWLLQSRRQYSKYKKMVIYAVINISDSLLIPNPIRRTARKNKMAKDTLEMGLRCVGKGRGRYGGEERRWVMPE